MLIIFIGISLFALCKIINWRFANKKIDEQLSNLYDETSMEEKQDDTAQAINPPNNQNSDYWYYMKMDMLNVDFNDLLKKNSETVGWIKLNGTNINYPIVQTNNNEYYLTHSFDKKNNEAGWIFMDYRNDIDNFDQNTIIYGHSRLDKTMFGSLKNITKSDWYKNKDNYIVKLSTPKKNTLWQVFSVYKIPTETYYLTSNFKNDEEYDKFLTTIKNRSIYKFNAEVNSKDKILTLSTCSDGDKKVVMHARLIKQANK